MGSHLAPKAKVQVNHGLTWTFFVAGTGFEPVTSGRDRGTCDNYGVDTIPTGFLGFTRNSSVLRVSGYPLATESQRFNLDPKWTLVDSGHAVNRHSPPQPRAR